MSSSLRFTKVNMLELLRSRLLILEEDMRLGHINIFGINNSNVFKYIDANIELLLLKCFLFNDKLNFI